MALSPQEQRDLLEAVGDRLEEMRDLFTGPYKLTLVARAPHLPDGDVYVSSDDIHQVIAALERLATYDEVRH